MRPHRWSVTGGFPPALFPVAVLVLAGVPAATAGPAERVAALFRQGDTAEAVAVVDSLAAAGPLDTNLLAWRYRLATDPDVARRLALELLARPDLSPVTRRFVLHDLAADALAAGDPEACLRWLTRLAAAGGAVGPNHGVLAGLAHWLAAHPDRARDALAAVTPSEPDFCRARWLLGELARRDGDAALARHYWETALRNAGDDCRPDLLASLATLTAPADSAAAAHLALSLSRDYPGSLPALGLSLPSPAALPAAPGTATGSRVPADRSRSGWALQLAAFRDRGRALALQRRWEPRLGPLRVVSGPNTPDGDIVHRVRSPLLPDRRTAERLARRWRHDTHLQPAIVREDATRP